MLTSTSNERDRPPVLPLGQADVLGVRLAAPARSRPPATSRTSATRHPGQRHHGHLITRLGDDHGLTPLALKDPAARGFLTTIPEG